MLNTKKVMIKVYILFLTSILLPRTLMLQLLGNFNIIEAMYLPGDGQKTEDIEATDDEIGGQSFKSSSL